jgi:hypothetical protein
MYNQTNYLNWSRRNKYGAKRTEFAGKMYASKLEASVAEELELRKRGRDIKDWERQVKIDLTVNGHYITTHYVDFLVHHKDGSKELVEAKGVATPLWILKRRLLEAVYLPDHPDTTYTVVTGTRTYRPTHRRLRRSSATR